METPDIDYPSCQEYAYVAIKVKSSGGFGTEILSL